MRTVERVVTRCFRSSAIAVLTLSVFCATWLTNTAPGTDLPVLPESQAFDHSWPSFRGPNGSGVSRHTDVPTSWNGTSGAGIVWKVETPLPGVNSPIVWQDRIFLSGATKDRREVYCFSAASGELLWQREVTGDSVVSDQPMKINDDTSFAAPSMATDGRLVYAMFANGDLAAFDLSGSEIWSRSLGIPKNHYGHASSLATFNGHVIVQLDQGTPKDDYSKLLSIEGATGLIKWQVTRQVPATWSSPIVVKHESQPMLITCSDPWVIAYSPTSGDELWRADCLAPAEVGPSPIYSAGMVFAANDYAALSAIRVDGRGDVTDTHVAWSVDEGLPDICSPLATERFILLLDASGVLTCYDKSTGGDPLWEEDFDAEFMSSPSLVGNRVYLFDRQGKTWIVEPTDKACKHIAESELGEGCVTSPAFQDGRIYIRGEKHLFCIGTL